MVLIDHRKIFVAWHWPYFGFSVWREPTLTARRIGWFEVTMPKRGYWLGHDRS